MSDNFQETIEDYEYHTCKESRNTFHSQRYYFPERDSDEYLYIYSKTYIDIIEFNNSLWTLVAHVGRCCCCKENIITKINFCPFCGYAPKKD